jgi:hypothetical protein
MALSSSVLFQLSLILPEIVTRMATVDELREMAQDLYARARASRDPFTKQKLRKAAADYLKEAEQLRRSQNIQVAFPKKENTMKSTKYRTAASVLAIVLGDMQAAGLYDLKPDKEISLERDKEISLAPEVEVSEMPAMSLAETALQPSKEKEQEGGARKDQGLPNTEFNRYQLDL